MSKKYVITDPCYILPDDVWSECCNKAGDNDEGWSERFYQHVTSALTEFVGTTAYAESTGYGDWQNSIVCGPYITGQFFADSGSVCVCEYTDKVREALDGLEDKGGAAVFEAEGRIEVQFDTKVSDWTVVHISDEANTEWITESAYPDDEDEEW